MAVSASYVLTGKDASFKGVTVKNPFSLKDHTWGAWEATARWSGLQVDDDAFESLANGATSARRADGYAVGLNWYLNKNLKWQANFEQTEFEGGSVEGDRENEQVFLTRWQVSY